MSKKAIIFDIDGTAIDSPSAKLPPPGLADEIQRLKDKHFFCAATGRSQTWAKIAFDSLRLTDPAIVAGGTQICDPVTGKILWQKNIQASDLQAALDIFAKFPDYKMLYNDYSESDYFEGGITYAEYNHTDPVFFLERIHIPNHDADAMYRQLLKIKNITCLQIADQLDPKGSSDLHIIHKEATKEQAIAELLNIIGVDKKDTIGIGDGSNDLHLFNAVGHKVAMGNAVPALKKRADLVIDSVKDNGLTAYLQTL